MPGDVVVQICDPTRDEFVVLACDGICDRLTNRDCADLVRNLVHREGETDVGLVCEEVIDEALEKESRDNMTACAVFLPAAMMHRPAKIERPEQDVCMRAYEYFFLRRMIKNTSSED